MPTGASRSIWPAPPGLLRPTRRPARRRSAPFCKDVSLHRSPGSRLHGSRSAGQDTIHSAAVMDRRIFGMALACGLRAPFVRAQVSIEPRPRRAPKQPSIPSANLRVDTNLVLVPVTVNDELHHPITGLEKNNFRVFDDKVEQTISAFSTEDEPIALGLVFDTSGSMRGTFPQGRMATTQFLRSE